MSGISHSLPLNEHLSAKAISSLLVDELARLKERVGGPVTLAPFGDAKECIDSTTKVVVSAQCGQPAAVIVCSRPAAPEVASRAAKVAEEVRDVVGKELGEAIIRPIVSGHIQGRSYVLLPYCPDFSAYKPVRLAQRMLIRRPLLNWLQQATASAVKAHSAADAKRSFTAALEHLEQQNLFDEGVQTEIRRSLQRIELGQWQPRHTFDHNDLWLGNVMLAPKTTMFAPSRYPFVLIDWPGANPMGYGIYDLIRIAPELKLSAAGLKKELIAHSLALQCDLEDTRGHLLAALGYLHMNIENFPERRYIKNALSCWNRLNRALPLSPPK